MSKKELDTNELDRVTGGARGCYEENGKVYCYFVCPDCGLYYERLSFDKPILDNFVNNTHPNECPGNHLNDGVRINIYGNVVAGTLVKK